MPRLQWAGFIRGNLADYQCGSLPPEAVRLSMPTSTGRLMVKAAVFIPLPITVIFAAMLGKTLASSQVVVSPLWIAVGVCAGFPALVLHELLHAVAYPREALVTIGFYPKALAAVALVSYPLSRGRYILMSLLPTLLGILPMALFLWLPPDWRAWNGFLFGLAVMGLVSPYPDFYNVYQILRQTPRKCSLQCWKDDLYYIL